MSNRRQEQEDEKVRENRQQQQNGNDKINSECNCVGNEVKRGRSGTEK